MTLGELIQWLETQDKNDIVTDGFSSPHSDRGFYYNLAFTPQPESRIGDMLDHAKGAVGSTFTGYKGGDYFMDLNTEVLIGGYESCGEEINSYTLKYWEQQINERKNTIV